MSGSMTPIAGERKRRICYFFDSDIGNYHYGPGHPMKPHRIRMTHALVMNYGLYKKMEIFRAKPATRKEMAQFHTDDYVEFLSKVTPDNMDGFLKEQAKFNLGDDCPVFDGLFEYCSISAGGSMEGAARLSRDKCDIAVNWAGGLHHAKKAEANGFCYVNDIVLGILELLRYHKRVLYVDIDVHHGDGVEEAFYTTDRVMTCSFHKYGEFFPGTGELRDTGHGKGKHYAVNFPLRDGITDESYKNIFEPVIMKIMETYQPSAIVLQCGGDSLSGDRLGSFNVSMRGHANCVQFIKSLGLPLLLLGGGGYTIRNVSRTWAYETGLAAGQQLCPDIPMNEYYEYYGPTYRLDVPPSNMEDMNVEQYLEKTKIQIFENLRHTIPVPSVGLQPIPKMAHDEMEVDEDLDDPNVRRPQRLLDGLVQRDDEFSDSEDEGEGGRRNVQSHKRVRRESARSLKTNGHGPSMALTGSGPKPLQSTASRRNGPAQSRQSSLSSAATTGVGSDLMARQTEEPGTNRPPSPPSRQAPASQPQPPVDTKEQEVARTGSSTSNMGAVAIPQATEDTHMLSQDEQSGQEKPVSDLIGPSHPSPSRVLPTRDPQTQTQPAPMEIDEPLHAETSKAGPERDPSLESANMERANNSAPAASVVSVPVRHAEIIPLSSQPQHQADPSLEQATSSSTVSTQTTSEPMASKLANARVETSSMDIDLIRSVSSSTLGPQHFKALDRQSKSGSDQMEVEPTGGSSIARAEQSQGDSASGVASGSHAMQVDQSLHFAGPSKPEPSPLSGSVIPPVTEPVTVPVPVIPMQSAALVDERVTKMTGSRATPSPLLSVSDPLLLVASSVAPVGHPASVSETDPSLGVPGAPQQMAEVRGAHQAEGDRIELERMASELVSEVEQSIAQTTGAGKGVGVCGGSVQEARAKGAQTPMEMMDPQLNAVPAMYFGRPVTQQGHQAAGGEEREQAGAGGSRAGEGAGLGRTGMSRERPSGSISSEHLHPSIDPLITASALIGSTSVGIGAGSVRSSAQTSSSNGGGAGFSSGSGASGCGGGGNERH